MRWRLPLAVACLSLALAAPARAGIGKGCGEFGIDFGATILDKDVTGQDAFRLAPRGGYHITNLFEIEGEGSVAIHFTESHPNGSKSLDADNLLDTLLVNGVFNFHAHHGRIVPYVLGGFGVAKLKAHDFESPDTGSATQVAAGGRFFFGQRGRAAFRVEASDLWENSFGTRKTHPSYVVGFTWRL